MFFSTKKLTSPFVLFFALSMCLFIACEEDTTVDSNCAVDITNLSLSANEVAANGTLTATVTVKDEAELTSVFWQSSGVSLHLSTDNAYDSGDVSLDAFLANNGVTISGTTVTLNYDQVDIPASTAAGSYFVIARFGGTICSDGSSIPADTRAVALTVN